MNADDITWPWRHRGSGRGDHCLKAFRTKAATSGERALRIAMSHEVVGLLAARMQSVSGEAGVQPAASALEAQRPAHRDAVDRAALADDPRRVASLVAEADLEATRNLDRVITRLSQCGEAARARQLGRLLADYDFDAAMPLLESLAHGLGVQLDRKRR
jgi:hypothetical protein